MLVSQPVPTSHDIKVQQQQPTAESVTVPINPLPPASSQLRTTAVVLLPTALHLSHFILGVPDPRLRGTRLRLLLYTCVLVDPFSTTAVPF